MPSEFCRYCGAGVGVHRRIGEGTCQKCDPPGDRWRGVVTEMGARFTSLNSIPVERATIRRPEWDAILRKIQDQAERIENLEAAFDGPELPL